MGMWIAKGIAHGFDQFADLFPLELNYRLDGRAITLSVADAAALN